MSAAACNDACVCAHANLASGRWGAHLGVTPLLKGTYVAAPARVRGRQARLQLRRHLVEAEKEAGGRVPPGTRTPGQSTSRQDRMQVAKLVQAFQPYSARFEKPCFRGHALCKRCHFAQAAKEAGGRDPPGTRSRTLKPASSTDCLSSCMYAYLLKVHSTHGHIGIAAA